MNDNTDMENNQDPRFGQFLQWEQESRDTIDFKRVYVDITGDLIAGLMLSQIIYWHLPNKEGKTKLRVKKRGVLCLAKSRYSWWDEVRINPTQADKGLSILRKKGIIRTHIYRFNGSPTTHLFLRQKTFLDLMGKQDRANKKNPYLEKAKIQLAKRESRSKKNSENINIDYGIEHGIDFKEKDISPSASASAPKNKPEKLKDLSAPKDLGKAKIESKKRLSKYLKQHPELIKTG